MITAVHEKNDDEVLTCALMGLTHCLSTYVDVPNAVQQFHSQTLKKIALRRISLIMKTLVRFEHLKSSNNSRYII